MFLIRVEKSAESLPFYDRWSEPPWVKLLFVLSFQYPVSSKLDKDPYDIWAPQICC